MSYRSVDQLQNVLASEVFSYAKDAKKAAGRALGTVVEIITFYLIKSWNLETNTAIERSLPEYKNEDIGHNVEFSLHPILSSEKITIDYKLPLTAKKILKYKGDVPEYSIRTNIKGKSLLNSKNILKNSCTIYEGRNYFINIHINDLRDTDLDINFVKLHNKPFSIFECKRVGIEEGTKKGPQTIEKAKQGAYVAKSLSSLQKIRMNDGTIGGLLHIGNKTFIKNYYDFLNEIIKSDRKDYLESFILTVGVVSNHGNWFTSDNHNKELKVLAQSYDWLLFLTDDGIAQFIEELLLSPSDDYLKIKDSFIKSYSDGKKLNVFTKSNIALEADIALQKYFKDRKNYVNKWFNIIAPKKKKLSELRKELLFLCNKNWINILK